jgi:hypothetical protein
MINFFGLQVNKEMKTKQDIKGQLKRLVENTKLPLKADYNSVYGGWL